MQEPLEKAPPPYSSFEATMDYNNVLFVYSYDHMLGSQNLAYILTAVQDDKIISRDFLRWYAGNYMKSSYNDVKCDDAHDTGPVFSEERENVRNLCRDLSWAKNWHNSTLDDEEQRQIHYSEILLVRKQIQEQVVKEYPYLQMLNDANFARYKSSGLDQFLTNLEKPRSFSSLANLFINDFFYFCCYASPVDRVRAIEIGIRKGKELLPRLRDSSQGMEPSATTCLWIVIQYHDMAVKSEKDFVFRFDLLVNDNQADHRGGIFAGREGVQKSPSAPVIFATAMREMMEHNSRARAAVQFLEYDGHVKNRDYFRLADILIHMEPVVSPITRAGIAFASGLHPRLRRGGRWDENWNFEEQYQSLVSTLDPDLVRMIWRFVVAEPA